MHLNSRKNIAITGGLCYNYNCSGARVAGRFALETPSNQHNIVLWAKRPPYGDSRPAVRLNNDGNHTGGALIMDTQKEYRTCPGCGELFRPTGKGMYCGPVCRNAAKGKVSHTRGFPDRIENCITCGKEFRPRHGNQKRCRSCMDNKIYPPNEREYGRFLILNRDEFRCVYCGRSSIEDQTELEVDHIIPWKEGGTNQALNLVTSCKKCNHEKSATQLDESVRERIESIVQQRNKQASIDDNQIIKLRHG